MLREFVIVIRPEYLPALHISTNVREQKAKNRKETTSVNQSDDIFFFYFTVDHLSYSK